MKQESQLGKGGVAPCRFVSQNTGILLRVSAPIHELQFANPITYIQQGFNLSAAGRQQARTPPRPAPLEYTNSSS